jgi:hypothetical protein
LPEIVSWKPILSTELQKGREWSTTLRNDQAKTGIIFLTPENVASPWIHFEAGALATALGSRNGEVFTYVYVFDPGKLAGPLSAYQSAVATKEDTRRLVHDVCVAVEFEPPPEKIYSREAKHNGKHHPMFYQFAPCAASMLGTLDAFSIFS